MDIEQPQQNINGDIEMNDVINDESTDHGNQTINSEETLDITKDDGSSTANETLNPTNNEEKPETSTPVDESAPKIEDEEEIDVVGLSDHDFPIKNGIASEIIQDEKEPEEPTRKRRRRKSAIDIPKSRSISPVPEFNPSPDDPYDYDADEHYFDNKEIELPFENMEQFSECFTVMPPGEKRFVLDHMMHAANVMFGEYRRLNGQLRALNARSGRINKQVQREAEVVASGSDPRLAPRSSKNLVTSVVDAVIHLDEEEAERILTKKKITPTMRALLKARRDDKRSITNSTTSDTPEDVKIEADP